ncbi:MAG: tryptophan--tRNA ligase [Candidatus Neomarinimicrobiota bacterium]|nr:MAG: tryptophan--tRNA ligase [Candidatus Neomarinimicrobiota bacterium]
MKQRILSGIQPSGQLHLGNYFGMMSRMIRYQEENDLFCFIVNYHALTTVQERDRLRRNTIEAACDFLALGLDPSRATFWVQGDVPQVTELTWILSNVTSLGLLERATSYKDKIAKGITPNVGLFSYPILMAADILCFGAHRVPVGKDQKQHLEITRDIALRFNHIFGDTLVVPEPDIDQQTQLVPGIDGQKMSKSYHNTIPIFIDDKELKKRVFSIVTDSTPIEEPKDKNTPLFHIYSLFLTDTERQELARRFDTPGLRYGDVKKELYERIRAFITPYREKREEYLRHEDDVRDILAEGARKAREVAQQYLDRVRTVTGLNY